MNISFRLRNGRIQAVVAHDGKQARRTISKEKVDEVLFQSGPDPKRAYFGSKYCDKFFMVIGLDHFNKLMKDTVSEITRNYEDLLKTNLNPTFDDLNHSVFSKDSTSITIRDIINDTIQDIKNGRYVKSKIKESSISCRVTLFNKMLPCHNVNISKYNYKTYQTIEGKKIVDAQYSKFLSDYFAPTKNFTRKTVLVYYGAVSILFKRIRDTYGSFYDFTNLVTKFYPGSDDNFLVEIIPFDSVDYLLNNIDSIRSKLKKNKEIALDYILLGLATALRCSDLLSLTENNIRTVITDSGKEYKLSKYSQKTDTHVEITLPWFVTDMLDYNKKTYGKMFRHIERMTFLYCVKSVFKLVDGCDFMFSRERLIGEKRKEVKAAPYYEFISPHTLRRTAASYLYNNGVPIKTIEYIGGWSPGSKSLNRYLSVSKDKHNDDYLKGIERKSKLRIAR